MVGLAVLLLSLLLASSCYSAETRRLDPDTLPIRYPATVLPGSENATCASNESADAGRLQISQTVTSDLRNRIAPALRGKSLKCSGQTRSDPGTSCQSIYECGLGQLPSGSYWITNGQGAAIQVNCNMDMLCGMAGGWMEVANLNMSDPVQQCPFGWRYYSSPVRACGRTDTGGEGTESATYSTYSKNFTKVCGKVIAYQYGKPDAYSSYSLSRTIDDVYVDGITITYGSPREHVWTFAAMKGDSDTGSSVCPCSDPGDTASIRIPPWVGNDYFCESGTFEGVINTFYSTDPLFDGKDCPPQSTCCEFNTPPWFSKQLDGPSTGDIEVRVMGNFDDEDNPISNMEIWVQ